MIYTAAFDVAVLGNLGSMTLLTSGEDPAAVTLGTITGADVDTGGTSLSSVFWHYDQFTNTRVVGQDPAATVRLGFMSRASFAKRLEAAFEAAMSGWVTPTALSISWSATTGFYTIAYPHANFSISWSTAAGRQLLGFAADVTATATSYTGTVVPTYVIRPTQPRVSVAGGFNAINYEPRGIANHGETDSGRGFGVSRTVSPLYRDWMQQYEKKAKTIRLSAASTHPWTFQHLFEHCRGQYPLAVIDGFGESFDEAFSLRSEGTHWDMRDGRATLANDAQFHIPFQTVVEGTLTSF